jgi:hypothetical protein
VRGKRRLSPKLAVWLGLLISPALVIAAVVALGVVAAPAGSESAKSTSQSGPTITHNTTQSLSAVQGYWTPQRMAAAKPYPIPTLTESAQAAGTEITVPGPDGPPVLGEGFAPAATRSEGASLPGAGANLSTDPLTTCYHCAIPFTRWSLIGKYTKYPNSTVAKMFFTQDADGNGTGENYVCSASTIKPDGDWTAGHCVNNGLNGAGANGGWSYNVFVCPSYDNGVLASVGCWGADYLVTLLGYYQSDSGDQDMGGINTSNTGSVHPTMIGNITGWLGWAYNFPRDQHWIALGYPQGAPFAGGKIIMAASSLGYTDSWPCAGCPPSNAMGSDLTGGSSGGPWIMQYGLPGQVGGYGNNYLNGHNDWRHTAFPNEMNSPYFDSRFATVYNAI